MRIIIPGGSGQVGTLLARRFHRDGHEVIVLSRSPRATAWKVVAWNGHSLGPWTAELEGAEVVVNLTGRSVNCRYHATNRRLISEARVNSTRVLGDAIARADGLPC